MEDVGTVEVCVVLYCPSEKTNCSTAFKFGVNLSTMAGTAGMHLLGSYFPKFMLYVLY